MSPLKRSSECLRKLFVLTMVCFSSLVVAQTTGEQQALLADERNTMEIISDASRSVVAIKVSGVKGRQASPSGHQLAGGSGFVVDDEGHVITNFHVVAGALADIKSKDLKLAEGARITIA